MLEKTNILTDENVSFFDKKLAKNSQDSPI